MRSILFILLLCALSSQAQQNPFEPEIQAFEAADILVQPIPGQILLYGSSTIRLWASYQQDFCNTKYQVVNRGFGGSQTSDANLFFERVVLPHQPRVIFFYEGDNDINAGKSVEEVFSDFQQFVGKVKAMSPQTHIYFMAVKPSPSRIAQLEQQKAFNLQVKRWAACKSRLHYIDTFSTMLGMDGHPDPSLFKGDMLHMNAMGYARWTTLVQKKLRRFRGRCA